MYVQQSKKCSQNDRKCQELELVHAPSGQRVTFFIQQRYKYRQDGEAVVINDHVLLYNQKYNSYLHVSHHVMLDQVTVKQVPS